ncbi:MAG TPA: OST-HTH/LOTUS domain-containing protein, partial [Dongiaceae bacterium]
VPLLKTAIGQMDSEDGWVGLGALGNRLANLAPDFDPRTYGVAKLSDLVRKTGAFEIEQMEGRRLRVRLKPEAAAAPKPRRRPRRPRAEGAA